MTLAAAFKSSKLTSWKSTGRLQQTVAGCIERTGNTLHSGEVSTVKLWPELAGKGRYFDFRSNLIPASVDFAEESPLCTTLHKDGFRIRTVEHLLSALEAAGVDNCRIELQNSDPKVCEVEVPIFDGSASEWVKAIEQVGLKVATDQCGNSCEKMAPYVNEPVHAWRKDSFVAAYPSQKVHITYGIDFPQVHAIGCQWFSSAPLDNYFYSKQIASSRTFCVYEQAWWFCLTLSYVQGGWKHYKEKFTVMEKNPEFKSRQASDIGQGGEQIVVEQMRNSGLIKGGSLDNAIVLPAKVG
ncbi:putative UDP-3-O-acyl-N-acetylglucosamine deacetylase 1, mitochondrial isoform X3 [Castanea sativa]|uniref:putative UDP-3-O-acyl-N-acetylglucosamine deacetylase 1, mitochondrial isoform X3 n=1 Tax=Castanea sativa TaxID=21020 RepID=UPI003F649D72